MEARLFEKVTEGIEIPEAEIGAQDGNRFGPGMASRDLDEGAVSGLVDGAIPNLNGDGAFGSTTLAISLKAVAGSGKNMSAAWQNTKSNELSAKGRFAGVSLSPLDLWAESTGNVEHRLIHIQTNDFALIPGLLDGHPGDDPGAAGDVEHPVPFFEVDRIHEQARPFAKQPRDKRRFVGLGRLGRDLESFGWVAHDATSLL